MYARALHELHYAGYEHVASVAYSVRLDLFSGYIPVNENGLVRVYLDGGLEEARNICMKLFPNFNDVLENIENSISNDSKGKLQRFCQEKFHALVHYELLDTSGPKHNPMFLSAVFMNEMEIGRGSAHSKKESEKKAATTALKVLLPQKDAATPVIPPPPAAIPQPDTPPKFPPSQKRILALDFDGVICDSAAETAISAWKAAVTLWPDRFTTALPPTEMIERFRRIRPYLETGYQSILMMRMLVDGVSEDSFKYALPEKLELIMQDHDLTPRTLMKLFGNTRDEWIHESLDSWLAPQNPYPGTIESLKVALQKHAVLILTTKQERFVRAWLKHFSIDFPEDTIIGLDRKKPKEETLAELVKNNKKNIHFVEDRLATLLRIVEDATLKRVNLHYADWGYGTPSELEKARSMNSLDVISLSDFHDLLA